MPEWGNAGEITNGAVFVPGGVANMGEGMLSIEDTVGKSDMAGGVWDAVSNGAASTDENKVS